MTDNSKIQKTIQLTRVHELIKLTSQTALNTYGHREELHDLSERRFQKIILCYLSSLILDQRGNMTLAAFLVEPYSHLVMALLAPTESDYHDVQTAIIREIADSFGENNFEELLTAMDDLKKALQKVKPLIETAVNHTNASRAP